MLTLYNGLLCKDGMAVTQKEADRISTNLGFLCTEQLEEALSQPTLAPILDHLLEIKEEEARCKQTRINLEQLVLEQRRGPPLEGTVQLDVPGFKSAFTFKLTRKLDYEQYQSEEPAHQTFVVMKPAIDLKALRIAERTHPQVVMRCITTKSAKPALKVERIDDESI